MLSVELLVQEFRLLLENVARDHEENRGMAGGHHDMHHALSVAQTTLIIAPDVDTARLAWVAGILHNTDRLFCDRSKMLPEEQKLRVIFLIEERLSLTNLDRQEKEPVVEAVVNHAGLNGPKDSTVKITLMDADRIANLGAIHGIRMAQHFPNQPIFNPKDPLKSSGAKYENPNFWVDNCLTTLEWKDDPRVMLRLPKAKELAEPGFKFLEAMLVDILRQQKAIGMHPFPEALLEFL